MEDDPDDSEGGNGERRSAPRITARSLVEVRLPSWEALRSVYTVNLSQGGMRLSVGARAPLGTVVDIILTLPNGTRLHLPGKVAHLGRTAATSAFASTTCPSGRRRRSAATSTSWPPGARRRRRRRASRPACS